MRTYVRYRLISDKAVISTNYLLPGCNEFTMVNPKCYPVVKDIMRWKIWKEFVLEFILEDYKL